MYQNSVNAVLTKKAYVSTAIGLAKTKRDSMGLHGFFRETEMAGKGEVMRGVGGREGERGEANCLTNLI